MKMQPFIFNEKSSLNSGAVRIINGLVLVFLLFFGIANSTELRLPFWMVVAIPILSSFVSYFAVSTVVNKTTFCEWDYTERKKRNRFILGYAFIANALSVMLLFSVAVVYICIEIHFCKIFV